MSKAYSQNTARAGLLNFPVSLEPTASLNLSGIIGDSDITKFVRITKIAEITSKKEMAYKESVKRF